MDSYNRFFLLVFTWHTYPLVLTWKDNTWDNRWLLAELSHTKTSLRWFGWLVALTLIHSFAPLCLLNFDLGSLSIHSLHVLIVSRDDLVAHFIVLSLLLKVVVVDCVADFVVFKDVGNATIHVLV